MKATAIERIEKELKDNNFSGKAAAISGAVAEQLKHFCNQSTDFAAAVCAEDKTLKGCLDEILKDVGSSISDAEVYKRAVKFFMPDADIDFEIKIVLPKAGKTLNLSLESFI